MNPPPAAGQRPSALSDSAIRAAPMAAPCRAAYSCPIAAPCFLEYVMAIRMFVLSLFLFGLPVAQALTSPAWSSTSGEHPISPTDGAHPTLAPTAAAK